MNEFGIEKVTNEEPEVKRLREVLEGVAFDKNWVSLGSSELQIIVSDHLIDQINLQHPDLFHEPGTYNTTKAGFLFVISKTGNVFVTIYSDEVERMLAEKLGYEQGGFKLNLPLGPNEIFTDSAIQQAWERLKNLKAVQS